MKTVNPYLTIPSVPEDKHIDLAALLNAADRSIELEIGFGKGHFLMERARAVPTTALLGMETRRKWVHLVDSRITKHKIPNAVVYHGDAGEAFTRFGRNGSVDRIFINFPDPWWKARHEKRMVVCPELVVEAARLLKDGGEIFVQTDVDFRAEKYRGILMANDKLCPLSDTGFIKHNDFDAQSLREKKCIETGLPIYRLLFARRARVAKSESVPP